MAFAEDLPEYRELIEYGIEGIMVGLEDGDREGGWKEGPGYWDYGLSYGTRFAHALRTFTGGKVDLFRHPYLRKTGDFRLYMQPSPERRWNWPDVGKEASSSTTIVALARAYRHPAYQHSVYSQSMDSIWHLYFLDPSVKPEPPANYPLAKLFPDLGVVVLRSGFGPRDTYHYLSPEQKAAAEVVPCSVRRRQGATMDWGSDTFALTDGPARLFWQSLHPGVTDHLVLGMDDRKTNYLPPSGIVERRNQYVYIQNLYRKPRVVFVAVMQFGRKDLRRADFTLEGRPETEDAFAVRVRRGRRAVRVSFDLSKLQVEIT